MATPTSPRPRVVILGGGFGGLNAARTLADEDLDVVLIDRQNHHLFQPLLYQVASAALAPSEIAYPLRRVFRKSENVRVLLGEATAIDLANRSVQLVDEQVSYDYLIVATGATHSYFGHPEWERFAPGLKTIQDALEMRRRVLLAYEAAEREPDPVLQREWLTFVVVGGGPTGVELAGALAEIARQTLARDFRRIQPQSAEVLLLEAGERILTAYSPQLSREAVEHLDRIGARVRTGARVTAIDDRGVTLDGGERIAARTVLWAAGVQASPLARSLAVPLDRAGRVLVERDLTVPGHPEVFVIGDLASVVESGKPVPGIAPAAIQGGHYAAQMILRTIRGRDRVPFHYVDKGMMATIGRAAAVAQIGHYEVSGLVAWLIWLFIHILYLIGFRNRAFVILSWAWSYFTMERGSRLITGEPEPLRLRASGATRSSSS